MERELTEAELRDVKAGMPLDNDASTGPYGQVDELSLDQLDSPRLDFFPSSSATVIDHALSRSQLRWIDKLGQVPQLLWVSRYLKALLLFTFAPLFVVSLGWNTWFALHSAV